MAKKKILFIGEGATLAHITRPIVLARSLDPDAYEVHFACPKVFHHHFDQYPFVLHSSYSIDSKYFIQCLKYGVSAYTEENLGHEIKDDFRLIDHIQPDFIVGDLRLSLCVSAKSRQVPYALIANAYWSPDNPVTFAVPDLPMIQNIGILAIPYLKLFMLAAFKYMDAPINSHREKYKLTTFDDIYQWYTCADYLLYPDLPNVVPLKAQPKTNRYVGPLVWEPSVALPVWWDKLDGSKPTIYLSLGSSGSEEALKTTIQALATMDVNVIFASGGRLPIRSLPENFYSDEFLPGSQAASRSDLVITNGGAPSTYQAVIEGTPFLGIPTNIDQYFNMKFLLKRKAGLQIKARNISVNKVTSAVNKILRQPSFKRQALKLESEASSLCPNTVFNQLLTQIFHSA